MTLNLKPDEQEEEVEWADLDEEEEFDSELEEHDDLLEVPRDPLRPRA